MPFNSVYSDEQVIDKKFPKPDQPTNIETPNGDWFKDPNAPDEKANDLYTDYQMNGNPDTISIAKNALGDGGQMAGKSGGSGNASGIISGVMNLGTTVYNMENSVSSGQKESNANTINTTVQGASLGMEVGGPWGALIGAIVGYGYGAIKAEDDKFKRANIDQKKVTNYLAQTAAERERQSRLNDAQEEALALQNLYKKQLGISSTYK